MKRNYKIVSRVSLVLGILLMSLQYSCKKDTSPGALYDFSKSPALITWQYKGFAATPYVAAILPTANSVYNLEVTLSVATITSKTAVSATVVEDAASLTAFNTANGSKMPELPSSLYSIANGGKVTINPGQQIVQFPITFAADKIDFSQGYALAFKLTNPSGAQLTSNLNVAIVELKVKSIYEATYQASGTRIHPTLGPFPFNYKVAMSTVDESTIDGNALADLGSDLQIHVNPDLTTTVSSAAQTDAQNTPGGTNVYDPATKTFTLTYFYNTGAPRKITEKLVYVGP
jgi:hypothetical protein